MLSSVWVLGSKIKKLVEWWERPRPDQIIHQFYPKSYPGAAATWAAGPWKPGKSTVSAAEAAADVKSGMTEIREKCQIWYGGRCQIWYGKIWQLIDQPPHFSTLKC